jgi:hypothetical protein
MLARGLSLVGALTMLSIFDVRSGYASGYGETDHLPY